MYICMNIFKIKYEQSGPSSWKIRNLAIKRTIVTVPANSAVHSQDKMKTFILMMILSLGVLHCQRERRPSPPPGFDDKKSSGSFGPPGFPGVTSQGLKPSGGSGGGISFGSSFLFRWVYCNGSWKKVM